MRLSGLILLTGLALAACSTTPKTNKELSRAMLAKTAAPQLETFRSERALREYVKSVWLADDLYRRRDQAGLQDVLVEKVPPETFECDGSDPACLEDDVAQDLVVVTGSRISSTASNPSITNNQELGVEEGDIVKQIDDFLVILQDGRLFSVNLMPNGERGLEYTDRFNVYRDEDDGGWYDEMLVTGNKIIVTAYSYAQSASEVTIIEMDEAGKFSFVETFYISSDDYYSSDNYATRIIGDKFVVYTPIYLEGQDWDQDSEIEYPVVRRWQTEEEFDDNKVRGKNLFEARDIYKPLVATLDPVLHTVSICDIGRARQGRNLDCETTAFIGPAGAEFYVSPESVYVWTWPDWQDQVMLGLLKEGDDCDGPAYASRVADSFPSIIYRVPLSGDQLEVAGARGAPLDQFSMAASSRRFRSLVRLNIDDCYSDEPGQNLALLDIRRSRFGERAKRPFARALTSLPPLVEAYSIKNRWTDSHLVYAAGQSRYDSYPPEAGEVIGPSKLVVVPVSSPENARQIWLPGSSLRLERVGNDIVSTGYKDDTGLHMSYIDLSGAPQVASTAHLKGLYESEGRSHAFNSTLEADGSGLMGIPTMQKPEDAGRWWWDSVPSNVSFVSLSSDKDMTAIGKLSPAEDAVSETYECDVSCIDWYGNSRPIFTNGRVFALAATELVEGEVLDGRLSEHGRVNLTVPLPGPPQG